MRTLYCAGWRSGLLAAGFDFRAVGDGGNTFKVALYAPGSDVGPWVYEYGEASDEVANGGGYTAGGAEAVAQVINDDGYVTFDDVVWPASNITARYGLLYNADTNWAVLVMDFGEVKQTSGANFVVQMPPNRPDVALIRLTAPGG